QEENSELRSSLRKTKTRLNQSIRESENLQNKVSSLESKNSRLSTKIDNLTARINNITETIDSLNQSLEYVCEINSGNITEDSREKCKEWGHQVD
ncbi:MAG: hypothetical protein ABEJ72_03765, partial [Candidatus Aenigmatarchaeota archaeon]